MFPQLMFSEHSSKKFFAQNQGHMSTQEMLTCFKTREFEAILPVIGYFVYYRKGQKQLKKNAVTLRTTLAVPFIYDRA